jgi:hypothetical protein
VDLGARGCALERLDDVRRRADLGVSAAEVDDIATRLPDAPKQRSEVLLREARKPVRAWAHRAIVDIGPQAKYSLRSMVPPRRRD